MRTLQWLLAPARKGTSVTPGSTGRMSVALLVIVLLALLVWRTMDAGKYRQLTWLLLGFFAFRVVLSWLRSRRIEPGRSRDIEGPM